MESITTNLCSPMFSIMSSKQVWFNKNKFSAVTPSRSQRSLTCAQLSSAETYKTDCVLARLAAICVNSVLLPTPGSPPINTREAGTMPPPNTLSNSCMPLATRDSFSCCTACRGMAFTLPLVPVFMPLDAGMGATTSSTKVLNFSQAGHLPSQRGLT